MFRLNLGQLNKRYNVGQKLIGTIISQLPDKNDEEKVAGLLVSIVENQVKGLVPKKELPLQEFIRVFYKVGKEVDVEIISITNKGLKFKLI